jgi:hypothetical protein
MVARKARKGARKQRLSPEEMASREKAIIDDIKAGLLSYREIALKHGVSLPTVNNKARKAGISRGRRKGAKIIVPALRSGPKPRAKTGRRPGRPAGRKTGTKKAARRGRPPKLPVMSDQAAPVVRRRRRGGRRSAGASAGFLTALREVVLKYHPEVSLLRFEKMLKAVEAAVA